MAPPRRISRQQLEIMIDFLEQNKSICMGLPSNGTAESTMTSAHNAVRQTWFTLSKQLNAVPDGARKTPDGWKKYWFEWRHKSRKKANDARRFEKSPCGGPSRFAPLNDLEVRVLALSGSNLVRAKSKPIKELENRLVDSSDCDPIGQHSPEVIKVEPMSITANFHRTRSSSKTLAHRDESRSGTPPPRWALELEERRIAAEERMASALETMASIMRLQEERRSMLEERIADTLTSVVGNVHELSNGIQEAVMHLQRINPSSNGPEPDIKDHVFI